MLRSRFSSDLPLYLIKMTSSSSPSLRTSRIQYYISTTHTKKLNDLCNLLRLLFIATSRMIVMFILWPCDRLPAKSPEPIASKLRPGQRARPIVYPGGWCDIKSPAPLPSVNVGPPDTSHYNARPRVPYYRSVFARSMCDVSVAHVSSLPLRIK